MTATAYTFFVAMYKLIRWESTVLELFATCYINLRQIGHFRPISR